VCESNYKILEYHYGLKEVTTMDTKKDVAIVGIGCRFPGEANSPKEFADLIFNGVDAISEVPEDRWNKEHFYSSEHALGKARTKWGGFIKQPYKFDAAFFGLTPVEVSSMDPQQRLLLEVFWESLEDAGLNPYEMKGSKTGVFIGAFTLDHLLNETSHTNWDALNSHTATGSMMTLLSNRISYLFDLVGPSITLDTACSSSLVAVHLAAKSILNGECHQAFAGGVNLMLNPGVTVAESKANMLSPTGRSRSFDAKADGYVRGEGAGLVLLKPLEQAITDGDRIYAVIKGSATNQDGKSSGQTVPNGQAQQTLVREACLDAKVSPASIQYVEAHGTGTPVGDPIEANALGNVLSEGRGDGDSCLIGSVKSNFGHTEAAAGVAGLIKTAVCMHYGELSPVVHFEKSNPKIDFASLKLTPVISRQPWPLSNMPKLAGVNSFGFGGSNCHVVLEQAPVRKTPNSVQNGSNSQGYRLPISAKNEAALKAQCKNYIQCLQNEESDIAIICANASLLRAHLDQRLVVSASNKQEMIEQLNLYLNSTASEHISMNKVVAKSDELITTMVLSGMGPQWWAMGRSLLTSEPVFADMFERCDDAFSELTNDWSLKDEFTANEEKSRMAETQIAQTSNFALQVSLAALFQSKGVVPDIIVGHSVGETAAAYISGALTLKDAAKVVFHRSRLQQTTKGSGGMLAVGLNHSQALDIIDSVADKVSIAAINGPTAITLAGDTDTLTGIAKQLEDQKIFQKFLRVEVPYHSPAMEHLKEEFLAAVADIKPRETHTKLYSTVTGKLIDGRDQTPEYWWLNLRAPVYFSDAIEKIASEEKSQLFLEVGPHPVLGGSISQQLTEKQLTGVVIPTLRRHEDEVFLVNKSVNELYVNGYPLNWKCLQPAVDKSVSLPLYPWQRNEYRSETHDSLNWLQGGNVDSLLGRRQPTATPTWELQIRGTQLAFLFDHQVQSQSVLPAAAYAEMALQAMRQLHPNLHVSVSALQLQKAMFISSNEPINVQLLFSQDHSSFEVYSRRNAMEDWKHNAKGQVIVSRTYRAHERSPITVDNWQTKEQVFTKFEKMGFNYGDAFQLIDRAAFNEKGAIASITLPSQVSEFIVHPALTDALLQLMLIAADRRQQTYLPTKIGQLTFDRHFTRGLTESLTAQCVLHSNNDNEASGDVHLFNNRGECLLSLTGVQLKPLTGDINEDESTWLTQIDWQRYDSPLTDLNSNKRWLVVADGTDLTAQVIVALEAQGQQCQPVEFNQMLDAVETNTLGSLLEQFGGYDQLVWLPSMHFDASSMSKRSLEKTHQFGVYAFLEVIKEVERFGRKVTIWPVSRGAHQIIPDEPMSLSAAHLIGFSRVMAYQERPNSWQSLIDLPLQVTSDDVKAFVGTLLSSLSGKPEVGIRHGARYVAKLVSHKQSVNPLPVRWNADESVMLTGGLGDLAILQVHQLVDAGARHFILQIRQPLPPEEEWHRLESSSKSANQVLKLASLKRLGVSVTLTSVDITDEHALKAFIEQYQQEHPPIKHLYHCAGVVKDKLVGELETKDFESIYQAKVYGSWALNQAFGDQLETFVFYSSYASVYGAIGQSNYASANSFMDGLAQWRRQCGRAALSINFGPWSGLGMAENLNLDDFFSQNGMKPITVDSGKRLAHYLFRFDAPQVVVAPTDWSKSAVLFPNGVPALVADLVPEDKQTDDEPQFDLKEGILRAQGEERVKLVSQLLVEQLAQTTKLDANDLDASVGILDLGLDSLLSTSFKNRIESELPVTVSLLDLLKGPSVNELAEKVAVTLDD
jgi:Polyketide synthase modules and related proteins